MKCIGRKVVSGKVTLTVLKRFWFWTYQEKYYARKFTGKFGDWKKEPNSTIVYDSLSFQLNNWNEAIQDGDMKINK